MKRAVASLPVALLRPLPVGGQAPWTAVPTALHPAVSRQDILCACSDVASRILVCVDRKPALGAFEFLCLSALLVGLISIGRHSGRCPGVSCGVLRQVAGVGAGLERSVIARLGNNQRKFKCMFRVRHLHLQLGRIRRLAKGTYWGHAYFLLDAFNAVNPHLLWADGPYRVTCFDKKRRYPRGTLTYPVPCG